MNAGTKIGNSYEGAYISNEVERLADLVVRDRQISQERSIFYFDDDFEVTEYDLSLQQLIQRLGGKPALPVIFYDKHSKEVRRYQPGGDEMSILKTKLTKPSSFVVDNKTVGKMEHKWGLLSIGDHLGYLEAEGLSHGRDVASMRHNFNGIRQATINLMGNRDVKEGKNYICLVPTFPAHYQPEDTVMTTQQLKAEFMVFRSGDKWTFMREEQRNLDGNDFSQNVCSLASRYGFEVATESIKRGPPLIVTSITDHPDGGEQLDVTLVYPIIGLFLCATKFSVKKNRDTKVAWISMETVEKELKFTDSLILDALTCNRDWRVQLYYGTMVYLRVESENFNRSILMMYDQPYGGRLDKTPRKYAWKVYVTPIEEEVVGTAPHPESPLSMLEIGAPYCARKFILQKDDEPDRRPLNSRLYSKLVFFELGINLSQKMTLTEEERFEVDLGRIVFLSRTYPLKSFRRSFLNRTRQLEHISLEESNEVYSKRQSMLDYGRVQTIFMNYTVVDKDGKLHKIKTPVEESSSSEDEHDRDLPYENDGYIS